MPKSRKPERAGSSRWQVQRERGRIEHYRPEPPFVEPRHIGDVVGGILDALDYEDVGWVAELATRWHDIAGDTVARHTRPGSVERQCLTVFVDNSAWLSELSRYGQSLLLSNVRTHLGDDRVTSLRLRLDPGDARSY